MIQKISFENYKAFEKGEIKLKPITILLGANSVGKSSIINLLLMLQQTANSSTYKSALRHHGENVSMGECENIFRYKDTSRNISIEFEFESRELRDLLKGRLFKELVLSYLHLLDRLSKEHVLRDNVWQAKIDQFIDSVRKRDKLSAYEDEKLFRELLDAVSWLCKNVEVGESRFIKYYVNEIESARNSEETIDALYRFLNTARSLIEGDIFHLFVELCYVKIGGKEKVLKIKGMRIRQGDYVILSIDFNLSKGNSAYASLSISTSLLPQGVSQGLLDKKAMQEFLQLISFDSTIFSWLPFLNNQSDFFIDYWGGGYSVVTRIISNIIGVSLSSVRSSFERGQMNHISPLRAHPRRFYYLDKANINIVLDALDGNSLAEVLKENYGVRERVNSWLSKFGLKVDVSTIQDVVHQLKIHQHSLDLDITDVGFGISQILPIVVQGFLSFSDSLTMVEQPEIHLHPKMQADLADLFIDIVSGEVDSRKRAGRKRENKQKYLLIETHSEYLLKRLMRRIKEGRISSERVAVYFIEPPKEEGDPSQVVEKEVSHEGFFEWPKDFYEGEVKLDEYHFIKQLFVHKG